MIGDKIELSIIEIKGDQVKLGINAPPEIKIYRAEVYDEIQKENIAASRTKPELPVLNSILNKEKN